MHSAQLKEEWKSMGEKWKEIKINDERFSKNFQTAFISQLVEIGTGFFDWKVFFLSYTELNISNWKQERFYIIKKVFNRTIAIANVLKDSAFEEFCFAEFCKDNRAQSNFRFCFLWQKIAEI